MNYWMNKPVLITGANGFVGSNLVKKLHNAGAKITGLLHQDRPDSFLEYEDLKSHITLIKGDLNDRALIKELVVNEQIEVCFHLAAQVEVGVARQYPFLTYEANVRGTYTLLDAFRENPENIKAIVVASTDKSYGSYPREKMPYKEDYPLIPVFPYDVSKACADMIAQSYASPLFNLPVVITRFCNIYGPGQLNFSALMPDCIRCGLGYGDFVPRGNGMQLRDFLYVDDVASLYMTIAESITQNKKLAGHVFNAGTNQAHLVRDVVKLILQKLKRNDLQEKIDKMWKEVPPAGEIDCQFMDHEKATQLLGWKPTTTFDAGVESTIEWFTGYLSRVYSSKFY